MGQARCHSADRPHKHSQTHTGRSARRNGAERKSSTIDFTGNAQQKRLAGIVGNAWDENKKSASFSCLLSFWLFPVVITLHSACLCSNLGQMSWITACMLLKHCSLLLTSLRVLPLQIVGDWKAVAGIWEHRLCVNSSWVNSAVYTIWVNDKCRLLFPWWRRGPQWCQSRVLMLGCCLNVPFTVNDKPKNGGVRNCGVHTYTHRILHNTGIYNIFQHCKRFSGASQTKGWHWWVFSKKHFLSIALRFIYLTEHFRQNCNHDKALSCNFHCLPSTCYKEDHAQFSKRFSKKCLSMPRL